MINNCKKSFKKPSLNHAYNLVWNEAQQSYVPVAETSKSQGKKNGVAAAVASALMGVAVSAHALEPGALP